LHSRKKKRAIKEQQDLKEHISVVCSYTSSGEIFRPFIIFQRETAPKVLLDLVINKKCYIGGQESGWISAKGFLGYMNAIINDINYHRKKFDLDNQTFLLFTDGHNSRECPEALRLLKLNNIRLEIIPSHCSHLLQPCDLGMFAALKTWINKNKYKYLNLIIKKYVNDGEEEENISPQMRTD